MVDRPPRMRMSRPAGARHASARAGIARADAAWVIHCGPTATPAGPKFRPVMRVCGLVPSRLA